MDALRRLLGSRWGLVIAALVGAAAVGAAWAISSCDETPDLNGKVRLTFGPGDPAEEALLRPPFERAILRINQQVRLPRDLDVRVVNPREAARHRVTGPEYVAEDRTVYFPYSFAAQSAEQLKQYGAPVVPGRKSDDILQNAMRFVLYHEVTHGVIDILDVPSVGGEEEDADSLATIFAIATGRNGRGPTVPLSASALDAAQGKVQGPPGIAQYSDDHPIIQRRAVNALCFVYGSDPKRYGYLVGGKGGLTSQRAESCEFAYQRELRSWRRLLAKYLKQ